MKNLKVLALLFALAVITAACNKSSIKPNTPGKKDSTITTGVSVTGGPGVYAAGHDASKLNPANLSRFATLWKNGKAYRLSDGKFNATGNSVYADDKDVYVAGFETNSAGVKVAKLWVDGVATDLTDGKHEAVASSVFVNNGKVYVAGYEVSDYDASGGFYKSAAKLWINKVASTLTRGTLASSVYIYKNDIYVTGSTDEANAVIWKNGALTALNGSGAQDYPPTSIFVALDRVYVTGQGYPTNSLAAKWFLMLDSVGKAYLKTGNFVNGTYVYGFPYHIAIVWKDGMSDNPVLGDNYQALTYASAVFVSGSDVYIAGGNQTGVATLWKNGVNTDLTAYTSPSLAYSVYVNGSDVYVSGMGTNANGKRVATIWKNGVATNIGNSDDDVSTPGQIGGGVANSVFVVQ
jgi:hypothetical protein